MGLRTGGRRAKSLKNRVKSSKIELRFREVRSEGCTSCSPVLQALIISQYAFYGSASAEPFFVARFSGEQGSTTAHLRRLPRKGRAGGAQNLCSSIACRAQPCQRGTPVLQALIYLKLYFCSPALAGLFLFVALLRTKRTPPRLWAGGVLL